MQEIMLGLKYITTFVHWQFDQDVTEVVVGSLRFRLELQSLTIHASGYVHLARRYGEVQVRRRNCTG